jgi:hypothetical protein
MHLGLLMLIDSTASTSLVLNLHSEATDNHASIALGDPESQSDACIDNKDASDECNELFQARTAKGSPCIGVAPDMRFTIALRS